MKKYTVHIYAIVRVPITVEADSPEEAIKKTDDVNLYTEFTQGEYAESVTGYKVDEVDVHGDFLRECGDYDEDGNIEEGVKK